MNTIYAQNKYGEYIFPENILHRPACKTLADGEVWEKGTVEFIGRNVGDGSIIHAGTLIGDMLPPFSLFTQRKVYCFEPVPENYKFSQINIKVNSLKNVIIKQACLSNAKGVLNMETVGPQGKKLGGLCAVKENGDTKVNSVRLDDEIPALEKVSIIHLDVEGHESKALEGGMEVIKKNLPIIIVETVPEKNIINSLIELGYREEIKPLGPNKIILHESASIKY